MYAQISDDETVIRLMFTECDALIDRDVLVY